MAVGGQLNKLDSKKLAMKKGIHDCIPFLQSCYSGQIPLLIFFIKEMQEIDFTVKFVKSIGSNLRTDQIYLNILAWSLKLRFCVHL